MRNLLLELESIDFMYALIGIGFVFVVLLILIIYVGVQAKVFNKKSKTEEKTVNMPIVAALQQVESVPKNNEEEVVAAITAAIMMYYDTHSSVETPSTTTGFIVRKIKKI